MTFGDLEPGHLLLEADGPAFLVVRVEPATHYAWTLRVTFLTIGSKHSEGLASYTYDPEQEVNGVMEIGE